MPSELSLEPAPCSFGSSPIRNLRDLVKALFDGLEKRRLFSEDGHHNTISMPRSKIRDDSNERGNNRAFYSDGVIERKMVSNRAMVVIAHQENVEL